MTIRFTCAGCGSLLKIKDDLAGADGKCPKCKTEFVVPEAATDGDSAEHVAATVPAATAPSDLEESMPKIVEPPGKLEKRDKSENSEKDKKSAVSKSASPAIDEKPAAKSKSRTRESDDDFDPAAFLMEDKPRRPVPPSFEEPVRGPAQSPSAVENRSKRPMTRPPSSHEMPVTAASSGISASAHAKEMMMKAMEDSRLHAGDVPPDDKEPGFDWSGFFREIGLKWGGGLLFGVLLCFGLYFFFDRMMGSSLRLPKLGAVTGTVTLDGTPLQGATVYFAPLDATIPDGRKERARTSMGITDEKGHYVMVYLQPTQGVAVGKCKVWLDLVTDKGQIIPPDFSDAIMNVREVQPGRNEFSFEMKSK